MQGRRTNRWWRGMLSLLLFLSPLTSLPHAQTQPSAHIAQLIHQNRLDDAEKELWSAMGKQPDEPWALRMLGTIRMRQNRPVEAEALFQKAFALDPRDLEACHGV